MFVHGGASAIWQWGPVQCHGPGTGVLTASEAVEEGEEGRRTDRSVLAELGQESRECNPDTCPHYRSKDWFQGRRGELEAGLPRAPCLSRSHTPPQSMVFCDSSPNCGAVQRSRRGPDQGVFHTPGVGKLEIWVQMTTTLMTESEEELKSLLTSEGFLPTVVDIMVI